MYVAGWSAGCLGIARSLKVTAMDLAMPNEPIKVSTATSNFMIGVTAAASAGVYFARGDINPFIAAPVAAGVLVGAVGGSPIAGPDQESTAANGLHRRAVVHRAADVVERGSSIMNEPASTPESTGRMVHKVELIISKSCAVASF